LGKKRLDVADSQGTILEDTPTPGVLEKRLQAAENKGRRVANEVKEAATIWKERG
jgi:hypothetical protein